VTVTPDEITARLLYRDGLMLVIDKPAGFAVHKGPKGGESLEDHFGALRFGLPRAPALAHRLDRDTSGCLVLGRHRKALAELGRLFKSGRIAKTYWAVVEGGPVEDEGRIDLPLGRKDATRGWWMKHDPQGQPAVTTWKVLGRAQSLATRGELAFAAEFPAGSSPPPCGEGLGVGVAVGGRSSHNNNYPPPQPSPNASRACPTCATSAEPGQARVPSGEGADRASGKDVGQPAANDGVTPHLTWLALEPLTGRTHQLRVHCAAMGWPILGDSVYGNAPRTGGPGLHLHAREITVPLYKNRAPIHVIAPVPPHMQAALRACGWRGDAPKSGE
jgi:tRNA pseudouridine32 synthase / 23S rRNA pseudouridine746 synthase